VTPQGPCRKSGRQTGGSSRTEFPLPGGGTTFYEVRAFRHVVAVGQAGLLPKHANCPAFLVISHYLPRPRSTAIAIASSDGVQCFLTASLAPRATMQSVIFTRILTQKGDGDLAPDSSCWSSLKLLRPWWDMATGCPQFWGNVGARGLLTAASARRPRGAGVAVGCHTRGVPLTDHEQ